MKYKKPEQYKMIVEKAEDLSFNSKDCPYSEKIRSMLMRYNSNNITLENGQMVCLNIDSKNMEKISKCFLDMLIEYIQSEKILNECREIKQAYERNTDNINNSSKYIKMIFDIIINMDRCYKYTRNIAKELNKDINSYPKLVDWVQGKIKVDKEIFDCWDFIYRIRNMIEHTEEYNIETTFFKRIGSNTISPNIIINDLEYDLLEIAESAIGSVYIISSAVIAASFLWSKYVISFADETRTKIFLPD